MKGSKAKRPVKITAHAVSESTAPQKSTWQVPAWAPVVLVVLTAALYSRSLFNGITFMDDDYYILKNPYLLDFSWHGAWSIFTNFYNYNYHPLTTLLYLGLFRIWGADPLPYHLANLCLHLLNVSLVYVFVARLGRKNLPALIVAALFAIHPMHVESVAWISETKDVLSAAFYLLALIAYLSYLDNGFKKQYYIAALMLFVASLLSKSIAMTLTPVLLILDYYRDRKWGMMQLLEKLPFLLLSLLFGVLAIMSQKQGGALNNALHDYTFLNTVIIYATIITSYLVWLVAPIGLCAMHFLPTVTAGLLPWYYYCAIPGIALVAWAVYKALKSGAYRKEIIFGLLFFFATISVMLQIVSVGLAMTAERYTYIPYIGLFYIAAVWVSDHIRGEHRDVVLSAGTILVVLFGIQTWSRIGVWKDTDTLFTDIVNKNPDDWHNSFVYNSWGDFKSYDGDSKAALDYYSRSADAYSGNSLTFFDRGKIYDYRGDTAKALSDFNSAIGIDPGNAQFYNYRGWVLFEEGNSRGALADFNRAISMDPKIAEAYNNRGWLKFQSGDTTTSLADFEKAIALSPKFAKPHYNRAMLKMSAGDLSGAMTEYDYLLQINPRDSLACFNKGIVYYSTNNRSKACEFWSQAAHLGYDRAYDYINQYCK